LSRADEVVRALGERDTEVLDAFLLTDPLGFLYPLGWLRRHGVVPQTPYLAYSFVGLFRSGELEGAALLAGGVLLFVAAHGADAGRSLVSVPTLRPGGFGVLVGPRAAVAGAWEVLESRGFESRLIRDQELLAVTPDRLSRHSAPALRLARAADGAEVLEATLAMHHHETLQKPEPRQIPIFRRSVDYQIGERRIWVWTKPGSLSLRFKAAVSAQCRDGAQLEGVYVTPDQRGRGFARRGLSELCQRLFAEVDVVSLYVNVENSPAMRLYVETLGFEEAQPYQTVFLK
jgi:ribosomal protein S18 acetylase RimI-like enzyme